MLVLVAKYLGHCRCKKHSLADIEGITLGAKSYTKSVDVKPRFETCCLCLIFIQQKMSRTTGGTRNMESLKAPCVQ